MLDRLLRVLRLLRRPNTNPNGVRAGCFCVLSVTASKECCLVRRPTEAAAARSLKAAIEAYRRSGFVLVGRDRFYAAMSKYLDELDIFIDLDLVVEYVAEPGKAARSGLNWWALRRAIRQPVVSGRLN